MNDEKIIKECYWICNKCGKEHKLKTLFCDECGEARPVIYNDHPVMEIIKKDLRSSILFSDRRIISLIIVILSFVFLIMSIFSIFFDVELFNHSLIIVFFLNLFLIIIAFCRLIICKTIKLWERIFTLIVAICFNPISIMIVLALMLAAVARINLEWRLNKIDINKLTQVCADIASKPEKYHGEYYHKLSELPEYIQIIKPVNVLINDRCVNIALMGGLAHYGWKLKNTESNFWNLYWYNESKYKLIFSDIIINTNTGEVTIPEQ